MKTRNAGEKFNDTNFLVSEILEDFRTEKAGPSGSIFTFSEAA